MNLENTNVEEVDRLIYALECASDHVHNTKNWHYDGYGEDYGLTGDSPNEWVNNELKALAQLIKKLKKKAKN